MPVWYGDSGGPFFRILAGGDGTSVEFLGVCDGMNIAAHLSYVGSWEMIQRELGPLSFN